MNSDEEELFGPLASTPDAPPKKRRGRPKGWRKPKPEAAPVAVPNNDDEAGIEWARAVVWAAEHVHVAKMTKRKAGNAMRHTYWQLGRDNQKQLLVDLMPKALSILDKAKGKGDDTGIIIAEEQNIAELSALLAQARAEAGI